MSGNSAAIDSSDDRREPVHPVAFTFVIFPKITETFVLREMLQLQKLGMHIEVFSLLRPGVKSVVHPEAVSFAKTAHYSPWLFSLKLLGANLYYLRHCPGRYIRLLAGLIAGSAKEPVLLGKTLALFPKSVYFAKIAQNAGIRHLHAAFAAHSATCALIMSRLTGIPYSMSSDQYDLQVETALHRMKFSGASFARTISRFNISLIERDFGKDASSITHLILRGIDLERYRPEATVPARHEDRVFTVLCVAALEPKKGHRFLIDAVHRLKAEGRTVRCLLVGEGKMRGALEEQVRSLAVGEMVELLGPKTQEEVIRLLQTSDCFVLPSIITSDNRMEGIPNALMEAMACCLPVISTDISGIPELVEHVKSGLLVTPEDPAALASAIASIQDNPEEARELGSRGREKVQRDFNSEINVKKLWSLLMESSLHSAGQIE